MNTLPQPPDARRFAARDRVLLYTRGMNIPAETGIALALESLRRVGPDAGPDAVMSELFAVLREHGHSPAIPGPEDCPLASSPPLNRTRVLPRDIEPLSLTTAILKWLRSLTTPKTGNNV